MAFILNGQHETDARANRDGYVSAMLEMMETDPSVVHVECDLAGCINSGKLAKAYPDRMFNMGIAEANAVGVAAGLSATGKKAYMHSFGIFASRRVFDQAFMSVAYAGLNVKIIGSDPGVTAAFNGGTHMPFEDCALYLSVPNAVVIDPTDYAMTYNLTKKLGDFHGLSYMRLVRKGIVKVYEDGADFEIGKGVTLKQGTDVTLIASGIMVDEALKAYEILQSEGISAKVVDMFTWKPIDEQLIIDSAKETGAIVTCENHQVSTGLGSAVANVLAKRHPTLMEMVGVQERFGQVGKQNFLQKEYNLLAEDIVAAAKRAIARKM